MRVDATSVIKAAYEEKELLINRRIEYLETHLVILKEYLRNPESISEEGFFLQITMKYKDHNILNRMSIPAIPGSNVLNTNQHFNFNRLSVVRHLVELLEESLERVMREKDDLIKEKLRTINHINAQIAYPTTSVNSNKSEEDYESDEDIFDDDYDEDLEDDGCEPEIVKPMKIGSKNPEFDRFFKLKNNSNSEYNRLFPL